MIFSQRNICISGLVTVYKKKKERENEYQRVPRVTSSAEKYTTVYAGYVCKQQLIYQVMHGPYAPVRICIYAHVSTEMVQKWSREG